MLLAQRFSREHKMHIKKKNMIMDLFLFFNPSRLLGKPFQNPWKQKSWSEVGFL